MGEAANISLKAIGKQDTHLLSKDPEDSLFKYKVNQHTNFSKQYKVRNISAKNVQNWPFGQTIRVQYNPQHMDDFLSNMWIKLKLPKTSDINLWYASQIGRHLIKNVEMYVDELLIEKIDDVWCVMNDLLYDDMGENIANRYLLNQNLESYYPKPSELKMASYYSDVDITCPLPFFFCGKHGTRNYKENDSKRSYFPVCGIHKQKITFEITFHEQTFFTNMSDTITLDSFDIITEEIKVSADEHNFITSENYIMTVQKVIKHPEEVSEINDNKIQLNLVPSIPVSCFHWVLRNTKFENEQDAIGPGTPSDREYLFMNRYNFTRNNYGVTLVYSHLGLKKNIRDGDDILQSAKFYLNEQQLPNVSSNDNIFFKYYVPFRHRISYPANLSTIYSYSFALHPKSSQPSGTLDFLGLNSDKTKLEIEIAPDLVTNSQYRLLLYYKGYETFVIKNGFITKKY